MNNNNKYLEQQALENILTVRFLDEMYERQKSNTVDKDIKPPLIKRVIKRILNKFN